MPAVAHVGGQFQLAATWPGLMCRRGAEVPTIGTA